MQAHRPREAMDGIADLTEPTGAYPHDRPVVVEQRALREDLDHALTRTMALLFPLLLLQSIPSYLAQRDATSTLTPVALILAAVPCALVVVAVRAPGEWRRRLMLICASLYLPVTIVEASVARPLPSPAYLPWLLVVAPVFIPSLALGARSARTWAAGNVLGLVGVVLAYAPTLPLDRLAMTVGSIATFSIGAFAGIRALRRRADAADAARLAAGARYDEHQRHLALEQERIRTDALIHDSLLNALLGAVAAANTAASRVDAVQRAREAVSVLDGAQDDGEGENPLASTASTAEMLRHELQPVAGVVEFSSDDGSSIEVAPLVRDALVSAALQAVNNSIKHAGSGVRRTVTLEPVRSDGLRITIEDDGLGFDPAAIDTERLGVRVSILKRVETVGGTAEVLSALGKGTKIVLTWHPASRVTPPASLPATAAARYLVDA